MGRLSQQGLGILGGGTSRREWRLVPGLSGVQLPPRLAGYRPGAGVPSISHAWRLVRSRSLGHGQRTAPRPGGAARHRRDQGGLPRGHARQGAGRPENSRRYLRTDECGGRSTPGWESSGRPSAAQWAQNSASACGARPGGEGGCWQPLWVSAGRNRVRRDLRECAALQTLSVIDRPMRPARSGSPLVFAWLGSAPIGRTTRTGPWPRDSVARPRRSATSVRPSDQDVTYNRGRAKSEMS